MLNGRFVCILMPNLHIDMLFSREIPQELIREARGGEVNLNMEDHRAEDYVKPKVPMKAFTGEGNVLGRYFKSK